MLHHVTPGIVRIVDGAVDGMNMEKCEIPIFVVYRMVYGMYDCPWDYAVPLLVLSLSSVSGTREREACVYMYWCFIAIDLFSYVRP